MLYQSMQVRERKGRGFVCTLNYKDEAGRWKKRERTLKARGKREAQREAEAWRDEMEREAEAEAERAANPTCYVTVAEYMEAFIAERAQSVTPRR